MRNSRIARRFALIELLVVIAIIAILAAILFPVFARPGEGGQAVCISNQRQFAADSLMWAQDHDELLPNAATYWVDIKPDPGILVCPTQGKSIANAYGYNSACSGVALGDIPDPTVAVLTGDWNPHSSHASNSPNMMLDSTDFGLRHSAGALFSFVDGHVAMYKSPLPDLSVTGPQSVANRPLIPAGTYLSPQNITITCGTPGAAIFYSINSGAWTPYTVPIAVTATTTISASATKTGMGDSPTATVVITIGAQVATPTFDPPAGAYMSAQNISLHCDTSRATIVYSEDGGSTWTPYSTAIPVGINVTLQAKASKAGMSDSMVPPRLYHQGGHAHL